jgi:hypothetical protein
VLVLHLGTTSFNFNAKEIFTTTFPAQLIQHTNFL